jgi:hypothetical protein
VINSIKKRISFANWNAPGSFNKRPNWMLTLTAILFVKVVKVKNKEGVFVTIDDL